MKSEHPKRSWPRPSFKFGLLHLTRRTGAALLIALAFLVLLSAVVLALFGTTRTDRQNASAFATGQETLRLADAAVNLVQGQIRDATIQPRVGWASQPGMIRNFGTSGNSTTAYKLYSSSEMVVPNFGKPQIDGETASISTWSAGAPSTSYNAQFCDLNSPAAVKRPKPGDDTQTENALVFPIADPAAIGPVEGFSANTSVAGTVLGNGTDRRLPMPVRWMYVLRDGQMTAPTGGDSTKATFSGSVVPTQANPIVGRIAFWADDETCKLNINTASEGSFWDVPKANTWSEMRNAIAMPVQGEFQRYVGHPGSTSLSPILSFVSGNYTRPSAIINATATQMAAYVANPDSYYENFVNYYNLTPRIAGAIGSSDQSSKAGTQRTSATGRPGTSEQTNPDVWPASDQSWTRKGSPILPDTDRLYATADELLFKPDRSFSKDFTSSFVSQKQFFLTANSRAPETTLIGTPRVSLWPQQTEDSMRNVKDNLINFCASVGNATYSFQRAIGTQGIFLAEQPADSPTQDIQRPNNQKLINYLRALGSQSIPGYGGSFSSKWGTTGVDRFIAQVFDTVRARTNSTLIKLGNITYRYGVTTRNPRLLTLSSLTDMIDNANGPRDYITPARLSNDIIGMGRQITFPEVSIVFMASEITNTYGNVTIGNATTGPTWSGTETSDGENRTFNPPTAGSLTISPTNFPHSAKPLSQATNRVQALMLFLPYTSTSGQPVVVPGMQLEITGLNNLLINGTPFGSSNSTMRFGSLAMENRDSNTASTLGSFQILANRPTPSTMTANQAPGSGTNEDSLFKQAVSGGTDMDLHYPFVSPSVTSLGSTVSFSGGTIILRLKSWYNGDVYQQIPITFKPATFTTPQHIGASSNPQTGNGASPSSLFAGGGVTSFNWTNYGSAYIFGGNQSAGDPLSIRKRLIGNQNGDGNKQLAIRPGDIVLSMQLSPTNSLIRGDYRLLALSPNISTSFGDAFSEVPGYGLASTPYNGVNATATDTNTATLNRFSLGFYEEPIDQNGGISQIGYVSNGSSLALKSPDAVFSTPTSLVSGIAFDKTAKPVLPIGLTSANLASGALGDWASGIGADKDGPFFPAVDSGDSHLAFGGYFGAKLRSRLSAGDTFEPNRMVPSAGILGGLMTTDASGTLKPWQSLLFNPVPAAGNQHPGLVNPPDHIALDSFWMPTIDPYPISEPLSTAGKINLNFQILPFTNIERSTAFRGALVPLMVSGVLNTSASGSENYKKAEYDQPSVVQVRYQVNRNETVAEFSNRFPNGQFYLSATEVSTSRLIPEGETRTSIGAWWNSRQITSDTLREQPYTALLSRVTTKSNTFTVHYRVQALRQPPRTGRNWAEWDEARDQVMGEYRGSTTIERFLDPNAKIPDYTQVNLSSDYDPIDKFYRWRVLSQKQFAP